MGALARVMTKGKSRGWLATPAEPSWCPIRVAMTLSHSMPCLRTVAVPDKAKPYAAIAPTPIPKRQPNADCLSDKEGSGTADTNTSGVSL